MPSIEVALRMDASASMQTDEILSTLNKVLYEVANQTRYITIFYSKLDPASRTLQYTNAGHPPPLILRESEELIWLLEGTVLQHFNEISAQAPVVSHFELDFDSLIL